MVILFIILYIVLYITVVFAALMLTYFIGWLVVTIILFLNKDSEVV